MSSLHKKLLSALLALCLCAALLCPAYAAQSQSATVVSQALGQTGYTEHSDEWTQFGQWYGIPHGYWCDMFVSWCANRAGVSNAIFPASASCTAHVKAFTKKGRYAASIARGGTYLPRQGDLIFFYDPVCNPTGSRQVHVGLVLYTENGRVFTVEGNSLSKRTDLPYQTVHDNAADDQDPLDYVTVNFYALDAPQIHGYAIPAYTGRDALSLSGFVDLGKYSNLRSQIETLCAENIMAPTSSHTFSPNHGMTRGEFLADVMALFGLSGWRDDTPAFSDVSADSPWYDAVMTARCAGIVRGSGSNTFSPDLYISADAAQAILSATLRYAGLDEQTFSFTPGDQSHVYSAYTRRADIAKALYALRSSTAVLPDTFSFPIVLGEQATGWEALQVNGSAYVSLAALQQYEPTLSLTGMDEDTAAADHGMPVPFAHTARVAVRKAVLQSAQGSASVSAFSQDGTCYISLRDAAPLLGWDIRWDSTAHAICLTETVPAENGAANSADSTGRADTSDAAPTPNDAAQDASKAAAEDAARQVIRAAAQSIAAAAADAGSSPA